MKTTRTLRKTRQALIKDSSNAATNSNSNSMEESSSAFCLGAGIEVGNSDEGPQEEGMEEEDEEEGLQAGACWRFSTPTRPGATTRT